MTQTFPKFGWWQLCLAVLTPGRPGVSPSLLLLLPPPSWAALLSWFSLIQQISQPLASLLQASFHVLSSKLDVRMNDNSLQVGMEKWSSAVPPRLLSRHRASTSLPQPSQAPEPFLSSPAPHLEPSFKFLTIHGVTFGKGEQCRGEQPARSCRDVRG